MTDKSAEHLSCLVDSELDTRGSRFLVRRLAADRKLQATWRRYHLVRACLHREVTSAVDLSSKVAAALEVESGFNIGGGRGRRWFKPVAGGAVAAAVAMVAVVGLMRQPEVEPPGAETQIAEGGFTSQPSALDRQFTQPAVPVGYSDTPVSRADADRARINAYVLRHNQMTGSTGFVSYVPIVTERPVADEAPEQQVTAETTAPGE